jgi:hypothetical protein
MPQEGAKGLLPMTPICSNMAGDSTSSTAAGANTVIETVLEADYFSRSDCPTCGGDINGIDDCFRGETDHIDNFDDVAPLLESRDVIGDTSPLLEDYDETDIPDDLDIPDGPFITDSLVCSERWCESDDCSWSERVYIPPEAAAEAIVEQLRG